jgi:hypothetical protein
VVFGVASNVRGRYDVVFVPMFKYRDMVWLWMVESMVKYSPVASGPVTGVPGAGTGQAL